jgi:hypothetical protein
MKAPVLFGITVQGTDTGGRHQIVADDSSFKSDALLFGRYVSAEVRQDRHMLVLLAVSRWTEGSGHVRIGCSEIGSDSTNQRWAAGRYSMFMNPDVKTAAYRK